MAVESKEEPELLSIETYSGKEIGQINPDATKDEIQVFIQEKLQKTKAMCDS